MTGIEAFLEILASTGVDHIFGNPGTTELPLNDALTGDDRFRYILGIQEIPVVAAADGFAQASGKPGVVNVHITCGLGNSMGMLYNAHCEGTPLLLTAGQQDRRLMMEEPVLSGDLISVVRPWTKWAHEVIRVEDIPTATRRAIRIAQTPPTGPVFLSLPLDVQLEQRPHFDVSVPNSSGCHTRPTQEDLQRAADILASAKNPAILAGSRVTEAAAVDDLVSMAELLGAVVITESASSHGRLPFPPDHPLFVGGLPLWSHDVQELLSGHDVLFVVGMNLFRQYIHFDTSPIPANTTILHLDNNPRELSKNYNAEVNLLGNPRSGLQELQKLLTPRLSETFQQSAQQRTEQANREQVKRRQELRQKAEAESNQRPMTPLTLMSAIARTLPANAAVIEEAVTTTNNVLEKLGAIKDPTGYFAHRGWALGWGLGCALGVKLAWPDRPVLALLGEGSSLYGIQGLWTAARYNIPVTLIICNNSQYQILKVCAGVLPLPHMAAGKYVGMDLDQPEIDFVKLANSFGVDAQRITEPDELADRLSTAYQRDRPILLDVPIAGNS